MIFSHFSIKIYSFYDIKYSDFIVIDFIDFMIRLVLAHKNTHDADIRLPSAANAPDIGRFTADLWKNSKFFPFPPLTKRRLSLIIML